MSNPAMKIITNPDRIAEILGNLKGKMLKIKDSARDGVRTAEIGNVARARSWVVLSVKGQGFGKTWSYVISAAETPNGGVSCVSGEGENPSTVELTPMA